MIGFLGGKASVRSLLCIHLLCALFFVSSSLAGGDPIRIGATVSLEGKYTTLSYMVRNGYELWAEELNRRGGLLGRPVELIFYDDKSRPELVRTLYEKLITEDKVDLVLSPYGSTLTMAAAEVVERHGHVLLAASASSLEIWDRGFKNVFGIYSTADRYFVGFLDLAARRGMKNIGVVYSATTFNISAAEGVQKWSRLFGMKVTSSAKFSNYRQELPAIVETLRSQSLDGVVFCGYPPEGYHFIELLQAHSLKPAALALTIIPALSEFYPKVGSFAENIFGPSQWEPDERLPFPGTSAFIESFVKRTGKRPSYQACSSYSGCQLLEQAVTHAGTIDHQKIRTYIASLDTVTIMGRFKVDLQGRQIGHNPILIQWQDGHKEIVYPTKMRTAPPRFVQ